MAKDMLVELARAGRNLAEQPLLNNYAWIGDGYSDITSDPSKDLEELKRIHLEHKRNYQKKGFLRRLYHFFKC